MEKDLRTKSYLSDTERFADLINGVIGSGQKLIVPTDLSDMDSQTISSNARPAHNKKRIKSKQRYRDVVKKAAFGINFMIIGIENQEAVHYLMPLRCMSYDVGEYERQAVKIRKQVQKRKNISPDEFLSGFTKNDSLRPCITLVLYYGKNWNGSTDLHHLLDFTNIPQELKALINNYRIFVCEIRKFENTKVFQTDLKYVFDCIRYSEDKEKLYDLVTSDPAYKNLDEDTFDIIAEYTKSTEFIGIKKYKKKGGKTDMCRAITELIQDGKMEGKMEGITLGIEQGSKALIETSQELGSTRELTLGRLIQKLQLSEETAGEYMEKYWH